MSDTKKCAHPSCTCVVEKGKYCSQLCEDSSETIDIACQCGHPGCGGEALRA